MSKFDRNRIKDGWKKLCTNKQTDTMKIMVTWPWTNTNMHTSSIPRTRSRRNSLRRCLGNFSLDETCDTKYPTHVQITRHYQTVHIVQHSTTDDEPAWRAASWQECCKQRWTLSVINLWQYWYKTLYCCYCYYNVQMLFKLPLCPVLRPPCWAQRQLTTNITVLQPLHRTTCISRHSQSLRTDGFCWDKVLLPTCPCWRQLAHLDYGKDSRVLFCSVTYTVSKP